MNETPPLSGTCHGLDCTSSALIKAHIIPAGFGRLIRGPGPNMSLSLEKVVEAKPQLGEFDTELLCNDCDQKLGVLVQRYTSKHLDPEGIYTLPVRSPLLGLNAYGFGLAGLRIIAKLDNRPLKRDFNQFLVNGKDMLRGLFVEFEQTPDWEQVKEIAVKDMRRRDHGM